MTGVQTCALPIYIGSADGVKRKESFDVYRTQKKIHNPETKEIMGVLIKKVGRVTVTDDLQEKSSIATINSSAGSIQIGDFVRTIPEKK